ncbi:YciI family protein [Thalassotalea atypica]|uniref:YciI family protein n=1 Tax=Thalassotalea atypica TaxID=2054316 RepID=UPI002573E87E|nr:YciI family protein [Thalassotalea atypica]
MFIVILTYKKSLQEVEQHLTEHNAFLDKHYALGKFVVSGRKEPRTGGVIMANAASRAELDTILKEDPFALHDIAEYDIVEFMPTKAAKNFSAFKALE